MLEPTLSRRGAMAASLLALPPEILVHILEHLATIPSWGTASLLCRTILSLAHSPGVLRHLVDLLARPDGGQRFRFESPSSSECIVEQMCFSSGEALLCAADTEPLPLLKQVWPEVCPSRIEVTRMAARIFRASPSAIAIIRYAPQCVTDHDRETMHPLLKFGGVHRLIERT